MSEAGARTDMTLVDFFGGQNPEEEEDRDGFYVNRKELFSRGTSTYDIRKILEFFNPSPSFCPQNLYSLSANLGYFLTRENRNNYICECRPCLLWFCRAGEDRNQLNNSEQKCKCNCFYSLCSWPPSFCSDVIYGSSFSLLTLHRGSNPLPISGRIRAFYRRRMGF